MSETQPAKTLPTSVVERYLSRASHQNRMVFDITFELETPTSVDRLRQSWVSTLRRHPRMHAKLVGRGKQQHWQLVEADPDKLFAHTDFDGSTNSNALPTPCVRSGAGAILLHSSDQNWPAIRFRFNHGACDGVGATRIVGDFLCDFHGIRHRRSSDDDANSRSTTQTPSPAGGGATTIPDLKNVWATLRGRNLRLSRHIVEAAASHSTIDESSIPIRYIAGDTVAVDLDQDSANQLRDTLRRRSIPLNDFAVAALARALTDHSTHVASDRMRVMIMNPVHMRDWKDRRSTANHVGFAFIRRRHQDIEIDPLGSIHQELESVRKHKIAGELSWGIGAIEGIPGLLPMIERGRCFTPSASLTCISMLRYARRYGFSHGPYVGRSRVKRFGITAPIQAGGEMAVTIWDIGPELGWSVRTAATDPQTLAAARVIARSLLRLSQPDSTLLS